MTHASTATTALPIYPACDASLLMSKLLSICLQEPPDSAWFCHLHPYPDMCYCDLPEEQDMSLGETSSIADGFVTCLSTSRLRSVCPQEPSDSAWFCHLHPYPDMRYCDLPEEQDMSQGETFSSADGFVASGAPQGNEVRCLGRCAGSGT